MDEFIKRNLERMKGAKQIESGCDLENARLDNSCPRLPNPCPQSQRLNASGYGSAWCQGCVPVATV